MSTQRTQQGTQLGTWPNWWRLIVIALSTLILCSCRSATHSQSLPPQIPPAGMMGAMPPSAGMGGCATGGCSSGGCAACGHNAPTGIVVGTDDLVTSSLANEWLCDGGDRNYGVAVSPDWQLYGLDTEDTVAHYDTLDGRTLVEPSNRVCIYAPRFGAVRTVSGVVTSEQVDAPRGLLIPDQPNRLLEAQLAKTTLQQDQPLGHAAFNLPSAYLGRQVEGVASLALLPRGFHRRFLPYENLELIRVGVINDDEEALLLQGMEAAIEWTSDLGVQVVLEGRAAIALTGDQAAQTVYTVEDMRQCPKLRVIKVASTNVALPGDTVDFTIRFDNVGDQPIGNIVLVDNLTSRLEYVPDSAQASVDAQFRTEANEAESVLLRWEITNPLEPGEGGIVRFTTRVR